MKKEEILRCPEPKKKKTGWIFVLIIILIILGTGYYGGLQAKKEGASCEFPNLALQEKLGEIGKMFCWVWKKEIKKEIIITP